MGGKAFEGVTRRILRQEIEHTLFWLEKKWPDYTLNKTSELREAMLGSAGKNPDSGDIDLNLEITRYDQAKVASQLIAFLGEDHVKPRPGNNQIFTAVPIDGNPDNGYVQIDFMFGNFEWQEFSYFSPALTLASIPWYRQPQDTSNYKGLYRTEMIKAIVAFNSDWVLEDDGKVIARVGPTFFHDRGCVWRYRYRPMRKDGKGRVQDFKEVSKDEFLQIFPSALPATREVINDPALMPELLFGERPYLNGSEMKTIEGLWMTCRRIYTWEDCNTIRNIYHERLNSLKVEIPDSFKDLGLQVK
jgi:hypothetical protein